MSNEEAAEKVLNKLEGTLVADLNSLITFASRYIDKPENTSLGGLNFTLFLISLIACETFGYFAEGAKLDNKVTGKKSVDMGQYAMDFIQQYFDRDSYFKKLKKVLADWLRNYLVHGFGSLDEHEHYDIMLFISTNLSKQIIADMENEKKVLKLNSIAVAKQTISAFSKLRRTVEKDKSLLDNIAKATTSKRSLGTKVLNEFNAVYEIVKRNNLTS